MAALTKKYGPTGKNPLLKGYKIHEEQIRSVAKYFQELYQARRPVSPRDSRTVTGNGKLADEKTGSILWMRARKTVWETGPLEGSATEGRNDVVPKMETPGRTITAIRCNRCGVDFPVADFLYTQKSGLCIDCWEEMVV